MNEWARAWGVIDARRLALSPPLSKADLYRASGVSESTFRNMQAGEPLTRPDKIAGIEQALRWAPGSLLAVVAGGEPVSLPDVPRPDLDARVEQLAAWLERLSGQVEHVSSPDARTESPGLASRVAAVEALFDSALATAMVRAEQVTALVADVSNLHSRLALLEQQVALLSVPSAPPARRVKRA